MPLGFIPNQDQGYLFVVVQLPDSASLERTKEVMAKASEIARDNKRRRPIPSTSKVVRSSWVPMDRTWVRCSSCSIRSTSVKRPDLKADAITARLNAAYYGAIVDARVVVMGPPPVRGLGNAGGFRMMIEDRGNKRVCRLATGGRRRYRTRQSNAGASSI